MPCDLDVLQQKFFVENFVFFSEFLYMIFGSEV